MQLSGCDASRGSLKRKKRKTERACLNMFTISGGNDEGVTPVPIPNTEVKPFSADGTWLVTARESRSPPDSNNNCRSDAAVILSLAGGPQPQWSYKPLDAGFVLPFG